MTEKKYAKTAKWLWVLAYATIGALGILGFLIRRFLQTGRWLVFLTAFWCHWALSLGFS
jgi:hypothetical protein